MYKLVLIFVFMAGCAEEMAPPPRQPMNNKIIFFGDSLTAGQGVLPEESFPALIEKKLLADGYAYEVVNAGVSGDTTSSALARIDWVLSGGFTIIGIELGANDAMRGVPVPETRKNLLQIIHKIRKANPEAGILLFEMVAFPNMGKKFAEEFNNMYKEIANSQKIVLVPFFLSGVAGRRKYNQRDGIHPTAEGYARIVPNIYPYLRQMLQNF